MANYFEFKGLPLVRKGNELYYGSMGDNEVVMLQVAGKKKVGDVDVATKVRLYRMLTDESVPVMQRITKTAEKSRVGASIAVRYPSSEKVTLTGVLPMIRSAVLPWLLLLNFPTVF